MLDMLEVVGEEQDKEKEFIQIDKGIPLPKISFKFKKRFHIEEPNLPAPYHPIRLRIRVEEEHVKEFKFNDLMDKRRKPFSIYHVYPLISDFKGATVPSQVNPRGHNMETLRSPISKAVEETLHERPSEFILANRGITIIAHELEYHPETQELELVFRDAETNGEVDGSSSSYVIRKVQEEIARNNPEINPLEKGRVHLEIIVGVEDKERIAWLSEGRNTSKAVKAWSIADYKGEFDFLKNILERDNSPFKNKIGWDEGSIQDVNVLEILALLNCFHPSYNEKDEEGRYQSPTISYTGKSQLNTRLQDPKFGPGFKALSLLVEDIIVLYETIYSEFEKGYDESLGQEKAGRLGRRHGFESRLGHDPVILPLTGKTSNYVIARGFLIPVLAAFRPLVRFKRDETAEWKRNPFNFWEKHRAHLVSTLIDQIDSSHINTPNQVGKNKIVYQALEREVRLLLSEEM